MSDTPCAIPLIELLKDVPIDGTDCYPISSVYHKNIWYGELCHAAAKEIEQLERERDEARKLADSAMLESDRLRAKLKQARDCFSAAMELAERYKAEIDAMQ